MWISETKEYDNNENEEDKLIVKISKSDLLNNEVIFLPNSDNKSKSNKEKNNKNN